MSGVMLLIEQAGPALTQSLALFVVQGLLIGLLAIALAWLMRRRSAQARYVLHLAALVLMLACLPANLLLLPAPAAPISSAPLQGVFADTDRDVLLSDTGDETTADAVGARVVTSDIGEAGGGVVEPPALPAIAEPPTLPDVWEDPRVASQDPLAQPDPLPPVIESLPVAPAAGEAASAASVQPAPRPTVWQRLAPWVVGVYTAGLCVFLLRLGVALRGGRRLRRAALLIDRKELIWSVFQEQAERLGLAARRLPGVGLLPEHIASPGPLLIGLFKPVILLPAAAVTQLTPAQLEAVIAHELAHLKRYDSWFLLFQRVVETLLFFHPMVWVVSARMSVERENACDDMVLAGGAKPADYASALVHFLPNDRASSANAACLPSPPATAVAAVSSSDSLRRRILRLFGESTRSPVRLTRKGLMSCAALVLLGAVMVVLACQSARPGEAGPAAADAADSFDSVSDGETRSGLAWSTAHPGLNRGVVHLDDENDGWLVGAWPPVSIAGQKVYTVVLTESDWHALSPSELVAIVDAGTSDDNPGQLALDDSVAASLGLPGEQVYQTKVVGYRTQAGTYGMVRMEHHPFGSEGPRGFTQVKRAVEQPDRFDLRWPEPVGAIDMRVGRRAINFVGDAPAPTTYDEPFEAKAGATYVLTARGDGGFSSLELVDAEGNVLATGHDRWHDYDRVQGVSQPEGRRIRLIWTAPYDGPVAARISFGDRDPQRVPKAGDTGWYTLDVRSSGVRVEAAERTPDSQARDRGVVELTGSAVMHGNTPPRYGMYHLPDQRQPTLRVADLLKVAGFDLNQAPYHRIDIVRAAPGEDIDGRLIDVPVFFASQLGRDVTQEREPVALRPGDKVIVRPRELFEREEKGNLDREALGWGLPVDGLMCRWKAPEVVIHPGQETVPLTVQVRNVSMRPVVWQTHWSLARMSREARWQAMIEAMQAPDDPGLARLGTSQAIVAGRGSDEVRHHYLRGGRMADDDEVSTAFGIGRQQREGEALPKFWTHIHFLPPGAVIELTVDYLIDRLANVSGGDLGIPHELFTEVARYNPSGGVIRSPEVGSMTCPPLAVHVLPGEAEPRSRLGPVIERDMSRRTQYLDLDTGEYVDPSGLNEAAEWGMWMIGPNGDSEGHVNLFHNGLSSTSGLSGRHVELVALDGLAFDRVTANDIEACWEAAGFVTPGRESRGGLRGLTKRSGPHAFRTLAGTRGVVELVRGQDAGGNGWTVRLRHLPGRAPFTEPGEAVEGVSLHLHGLRYHTHLSRRVEQSDGTTRPEITFNLRARHDGAVPYLYPENQLIYQLEVDERWYIYAPPVEGAGVDDEASRASIYPPSDPMSQPRPHAVPMSRGLGDHWYALDEDKLDNEATGMWNGGGEAAVYAPALFGDPLVLTPGEHTVRIAIGFAPDHARGSHRAIRIVSNPMQIRVPGVPGVGREDAQSIAPPAADEPAWGEPVEGVSLYLHDARYLFLNSDPALAHQPYPGIIFSLRARHDGSRQLQLPQNPLCFQLCVDGTWYAFVPPADLQEHDGRLQTGGRLLDFDPMPLPEPHGLPITRELRTGYWYAIPEGEEQEEANQDWSGVFLRRSREDYGDPLVLTPGEHTVHVAITLGPARAIEGHSPVRVVSNPMQIRVPGGEPVEQEDARAPAPANDDHPAALEPVPYSTALESLYEGADRREAAQQFRASVPWFEQQMGRSDGQDDYRRAKQVEAVRLAELLDAMAEEDDAWVEPEDLGALSQDELIAYHIYHLRDVAGQPMTVPGKVYVLGGAFDGADPETNASAQALREIAKPAIPALIALLDDERPIRCISTGLNGNHALRYRDAAVQILSVIAGEHPWGFMPHVSRGVYFSNAPEDVQQQVVKDVEAWWAANRDRSEADWLRDAIERDGFRSHNSGDDRAARLIALEGLASLDLFRSRMVEEPGYGNVVRLFWQAANCEGPAGPDVLEEIRQIARGDYPGARLAAYRILQDHGTEADRRDVVRRLVEDVEQVAQLEDWGRYERGSDFIPENVMILLCRTRLPEAFEAGCELLQHRDRRIVEEAIDVLTTAYKPEVGPALDQARLERLTQGLLHAIRERPDAPEAMPHVSQRYGVVIWLHKQHNLWSQHRIDVSMDGARPSDEQKEKTIAKVLAWFAERAEREAQGLEPEGRWLHDNGVTITGRVLDQPDGQPAAGVRVTLVAGSDQSRRWAVTDAQGRYAFDAVPAIGTAHTLQVGRHGPGHWTDDVYLHVQSPDKRFGSDEVQAGDLHADHPNTVTGRVIDAETGEGIARYRVRIKTSHRGWGSLITDENGNYRIYTTASEVAVECDGDNQRYYGPASEPDDGPGAGQENPARQTFALRPGQATEADDFKLRPAPRYSMRFVMPDGSPAEGLDVYVLKMYNPIEPLVREGLISGGMRNIGNSDHLTTDAHGGIAGYLRSSHGPEQLAAVEITVVARTEDLQHGVTRKIEITTDDPPPTDLELMFQPCGSVTFRVIGPERELIQQPALGAEASYRGHNLMSVNGDAIRPAFTPLGDGRYRATGLLPGWQYGIQASAEGYRTRQELWVDIEADGDIDAGDLQLDWWGPRAVPGLIEQLRHVEDRQRVSACRDLGALGPVAVPAIDTLIESLNHDPKNTVRFGAAAALGKIGQAAEPAVPHLIDALENDEHGVPREAATALGLIGDRDAIPALIRATQDQDRSTRNAAIQSLGALGEIDGLGTVALTHEDVKTRITAIEALAATRSRDALPALRAAAERDENSRAREAAESAIRQIEFEMRNRLGHAPMGLLDAGDPAQEPLAARQRLTS